jgi:hypothetical protein
MYTSFAKLFALGLLVAAPLVSAEADVQKRYVVSGIMNSMSRLIC